MPRGNFANATASDGTVTALSAVSAYEMKLPTVTLVNGATAGEAELFAGVLQEFGLTTVVGDQTAGRAMVQEYFPLPSDNAAVKLSVSELSLLKAGSWEGKGITPDRKVALSKVSEYLDLIDDADDVQLQAAMLLLTDSSEETEMAETTSTTTGATLKTTAKTTATTKKNAQ